jgi:hypothetical protein
VLIPPSQGRLPTTDKILLAFAVFGAEMACLLAGAVTPACILPRYLENRLKTVRIRRIRPRIVTSTFTSRHRSLETRGS